MDQAPAAEEPQPDFGLMERLRCDPERALGVLRAGELRIAGRLTEASNVTLFCMLTEASAGTVACVYKPIRGERPLDDFPRGTLGRREVAAHAVSAATGWAIVPPTVLRDGPLGAGMVQLWVEVDEDVDVLELILTRDARLRRMAVFDAVIENGDRKGGHVLPAGDGHLHGCDHGVSFSVEPKLRTVLWGWRGEPLTDEELDGLARVRRALDGDLRHELGELLTRAEVAVTVRRVERLLSARRMPVPAIDRPAIPWPPF